MKDNKPKSRRQIDSISLDKRNTRKLSSIRKCKRPNSMNILKINLTRYNCDHNMYYRKIVTDLMYDEKKHIVSVFKEYLILDDIAEFLDRYCYINIGIIIYTNLEES
jgi:hypothetical protein